MNARLLMTLRVTVAAAQNIGSYRTALVRPLR
jgi:hypothetical protein